MNGVTSRTNTRTENHGNESLSFRERILWNGRPDQCEVAKTDVQNES